MSLGEELARAVAAKDHGGVRALLHPEIDFRGMTPNRVWEGDLVTALESWFEPDERIESIEKLETDAFADRERVGYRLRVRTPEGAFLVDQQAYLSEREGRIGWLRVMCAGFRPAD